MLELSERDGAMLGGEFGAGVALAMRIVTRTANVMDAHLELGCEASFTCAPYQLKHRPRLGEQIAWAESNAIVFANSVLGARTSRYGDFLDLSAAITGRAPYAGLHVTENRAAQIVFETPQLTAIRGRDIYFAALGLLVGRVAGNLVPAIVGLPLDWTPVKTNSRRWAPQRPRVEQSPCFTRSA